MNTEQARYFLALKYCKGIGHILGKRLIESMGDVKTFWEKTSSFKKIPGLKPDAIQDIGRSDFLQKTTEEIDQARAAGWKILCYPDTDYPPLLKHCVDAPLVLFQKGNIDRERCMRKCI